MSRRRRRGKLPDSLRLYFWEVDFDQVSWAKNFGYIVRRLLEHGTLEVVEWLRAEIGDDAIRDEITRVKARGLDYERVRRWIPRATYDAWAAGRPPSLWEHR